MPKRRFKPAKPGKKITKKQLLLPPVMIGVATLAGIIIMQFAPPPEVLGICLKKHNGDNFEIFPLINIFVDDQKKLLPGDIGREIKDGKECIHVIHTDEIGENLHIQYVRPIRLGMADFMQLYVTNNPALDKFGNTIDNKTITVFNNETGNPKKEIIVLDDYSLSYSYYSEENRFVSVTNASLLPPFSNDILVKMELRSKY